MTRNILAVLVLLTSGLPARGDEFPQIYNSEADKNAKPLAPQQAAAGFQVPEGFHVGVFASEPDVQNPIAMTWDSQDRLWIAENYTYAERSQRFDLSLKDRVLIFEDADGDGRAENRTVFTDQVQMLTGIEVGRGGVWLMCPPRLLFFPDKNRDDVPDGPAQVVLDGFEVAQANYHNFANGLKWGPDGWLYGRCGGSCPGKIGVPGTPENERVALEGGIWRYSPRTQQFEVLSHGTTNPWGHDWNAFGEGFFINTVNGHLWHLIPGAHYDRPFTLDPNPYVYELIDQHADHWHFDTEGSWTDSRDGAANEFGGGHAHSGMMIYQGDNWPKEYRGRLLTFNLHGRRANQEILERKGSGYVGRHGKDILIASDPFFRGLDLSCGPDGAVYAIDWSDTGECHENTGVHRKSGRIYRISYGKEHQSQTRNPDLYSLKSVELARLMKHPNVWYPRQARLILAERSETQEEGQREAVASLKQMLEADDAKTAYRALVTLHAMNALEISEKRKLLAHPNEHFRAWAVRLLTDHWPLDDVFGPVHVPGDLAKEIEIECDRLMGDFCRLASEDSSGLVELTLASTLQRMPVSRRAKLAEPLLSRAEDADDHNLPLLVWYGLIPVAEADPVALAKLSGRSKWPKTQRLIARRVADFIEEKPRAVEILLAAAANAEPNVRRNLLAGLSVGLKGWSRAPEPKNWPDVAQAVETSDDQTAQSIVRDLSVLFGDGRALEEVRNIVLDQNAEIGVRRSALQTLVDKGGEKFLEIYYPLLSDARLNAVAAKGLAKSSDPKVARKLVKNYRRFRAPRRPGVIAILVSRPEFAAELLKAIEEKKIPASDLSAFDVRQIRSLGVQELDKRVSDLWGDVRESSEEKHERIQALKKQLTAGEREQADLGRGRLLFNKSCMKCHRLFGEGEAIGPDLTGADRDNLDYLLENIVDPSAVLSKNFRMSVIATQDGRVLNGLVLSETDNALTLQTQTDKITIKTDDIEQIKKTAKSPMPDGLLDNLSPAQIRDLIAYLMQPAQVELPKASAE